MKKLTLTTLALSIISSGTASAHVSVATGTATANSSQLITLNVPHGCEGFDTNMVEVNLPTSFKLTRPIDSTFGKAVTHKETLDEPFELYGKTYTEDVRTLAWNKAAEDVLESDTHLYQFSFRSKIPNTPFKKYYLPTIQSCTTDDESTIKSEWTFKGKTEHGSSDKPAPALWVIPAYSPGWNEYTVEEEISDLSVFDNAYIVWSGNQAYSGNPVTLKQIEATEDVELLQSIPANTTIWVKY